MAVVAAANGVLLTVSAGFVLAGGGCIRRGLREREREREEE